MTASALGRVHLFGIRHHGPGSSRSLLRALDALDPDVVLLESPADTEVPSSSPDSLAPGTPEVSWWMVLMPVVVNPADVPSTMTIRPPGVVPLDSAATGWPMTMSS